MIATNPGGHKPEDPILSVEDGSAYETERWEEQPAGQERLQRQVLRLFEIIGERPSDVLSGYLVPFRSRSWAKLPFQAEALAFAKPIWKALLSASPAVTIISFGHESAAHIVAIDGGKPIQSLDAGWGRVGINIFGLPRGRALISLPHLSRYGLFVRPDPANEAKSAIAMQKAISLARRWQTGAGSG